MHRDLEFDLRWEHTRRLYDASDAPDRFRVVIDLAERMLAWGGWLCASTDPPDLAGVLGHGSREVVDAGVGALADITPAHEDGLGFVLSVRAGLSALGRSRIAWQIQCFQRVLPHDALLRLATLGLEDASVLVRREAAYTCHTTGNPGLLEILRRLADADPDGRVRDTARDAAAFLTDGYRATPDGLGNTDILISGPSNDWGRSGEIVPDETVERLGIDRVIREIEREHWYGIPPAWRADR